MDTWPAEQQTQPQKRLSRGAGDVGLGRPHAGGMCLQDGWQSTLQEEGRRAWRKTSDQPASQPLQRVQKLQLGVSCTSEGCCSQDSAYAGFWTLLPWLLGCKPPPGPDKPQSCPVERSPGGTEVRPKQAQSV